jgi:hypothetical protein
MTAMTAPEEPARAQTDEEACMVLVHVAQALLQQSIALLELLDDAQLQAESSLSPGSTVGKHFRHVSWICRAAYRD